MTCEEFKHKTKRKLASGSEMNNPKKGVTTIIKYTDDKLVYQRGKSKIFVSLNDFYSSYVEFLGKQVSSSDLHKYKPAVYDSKSSGHSCNCTVFFMILQRLGLAGDIHGKGVRGDPYWVFI